MRLALRVAQPAMTGAVPALLNPLRVPVTLMGVQGAGWVMGRGGELADLWRLCWRVDAPASRRSAVGLFSVIAYRELC